MKRGLLKDNSTLFDGALRIADPLFVVLSGAVAYAIYFGNLDLPERYVTALFGVVLIALGSFAAVGLYRSQRGISFVDETRTLCLAWLFIAVSSGMFLFLTKTGADFSRAWATIWMVGGLLVHVLLRGLTRMALRGLRRRGKNLRYVVIVGAGEHGRNVARRIRAAPWSGLNIRAFYDDNPGLEGSEVEGIPVAGPLARLAGDAVARPTDQVWIALPLRDEMVIRSVIESLRQTSAIIRFVPDIYGFHMLNHSFAEVAGMPVLNLTDSPHSGLNRTFKAVEDYVLATLLLLLLSPLLAVVAVGIKLTSPGPVLFHQTRVTWNGRAFEMKKFRTMPVDAEASTGPVWSRRGDSRPTAFGAWLRRYSLDELPQLFNVLLGEMSLVGPRPERPEFVEQFRREIPGYMQKHLVKAGITGWAQVNDLRGDTDLHRRIEYDLYYIEHWSLWFDLRILTLTLWHILNSRNAH
jgi:putative colanic acid biosynthesis UDP-glucose lipid carrier transferase